MGDPTVPRSENEAPPVKSFPPAKIRNVALVGHGGAGKTSLAEALLFCLNKRDRERASFQRTLDDLRDKFGVGVAPLELPIGEETDFHGVADLLSDTAFLYEGGSGKASQGEIPDDMADLEHQVHDNLVEGIVVA